MAKVHKILADGDTCLVVGAADMIRLFKRRDPAQPEDGDAGSLRDVERLLLVRADKDDPALFSSMASRLRSGSIAGGRSSRGGALPVTCRTAAWCAIRSRPLQNGFKDCILVAVLHTADRL
ncbi:MAG: hypothetical protein KJ981_18865 [Alphaproteobacteria bacterium]|nr:hypothetical protein [Alphaproteobacteria bacterium]MBU0833705.1 hypothetical protein [Alphaproteobacteria bacterium]MBU1765947.1 hypothetical protein [Alphaproteobacteria bacterium]